MSVFIAAPSPCDITFRVQSLNQITLQSQTTFPSNDRNLKYTLELTRQLALIVTWKWLDILIENNHPAIVPVDLFGEAYDLSSRRRNKPRGSRAAYYEPLDWDGLLRCLNHESPHQISVHGSEGKWVCDRDYHNGTGPICLNINHRIISEPITREFLKCLDLRSQAREVLNEVQNRAIINDDEQSRRKREEAQLKKRLANLENYLGDSDLEMEESYRRQIKERYPV